MSGHEETLLTELCSICHEKTPKYRCPRCSARTCSLPCTKRHKLWSQCSGVRDPAEYMKRNELATPSAFDKDFNFITGIERGIERAERDTENREIPIGQNDNDSSQGARRQGVPRGGPAFLNRAASNGVKVAKAPKGMLRNKQNLSFLHKKRRHLSWTVEWVFPDGHRSRANFVETFTIATAYSTTLSKEYNKKRKLNSSEAHDICTAPSSKLPRSQNEQDKSKSKGVQKDTTPASANAISPSQPSQHHEGNENSVEKQAAGSTEPENGTTSTPHFYLHRPRARSKLPVLIPISPDKTITETLRGRLVLEFPTIYVLMESPELVPREKFILEEEYILKEREGLEVLDELSDGADAAKTSQEEGEITDSGPTQLDEKKVLEVLKKDLEGGSIFS